MLSGKNIHKSYGPVKVLQGVDIRIQKGEVVAIAGPSGSGKSTLLHILGTLDKADAGEVEMNGTMISHLSDRNIMAASWKKRLLNFILDSIFIGLLTNAALVIAGEKQSFTDTTVLFSWPSLAYSVATTLIYYIILEGITGRSIAKYITQTKVIVQENSTKPTFMRCVIRTLCRYIPFDVFSFFSSHPIGWHDSISGTIVCDSSVPYSDKIANSLTAKQLAEFRNKHIGFVFQFHHLLPEFTALENVCIPGWLAGRRKREVEEKAKELLRMLGLSHRIDNKPNQLSGGEQQRVAVARALINKPDIVMADEPTGNLDSANAQELHHLFFDLRKQFNQTFLIVTHNEELAKLSDRVLHMIDGKIV